MDKLDEMRKMAGIKVISEDMGGMMPQIIRAVYDMAEKQAYDEGAEAGNATSDMVFAAAKQILTDIEQAIGQKLETDMSGGGMSSDEMDSIEHRMGADRNMEMGETNFKAG
jgi:hypothetical protein